MFCYFANIATEYIETIGDITYDSNWFNHPVEMQKYFIMIISRSHKPTHFTGLHLIPCSLEELGKV